MARRARGDGGQATVELALLLPVVAVLLVLVLEVGIAAREALLVGHAAREGARAAAVDPTPGVAEAAALRGSGLDPGRTEVRVHRGRGEVEVTVVHELVLDVPLVGGPAIRRRVAATVTMRDEVEPALKVGDG